MIYWILAWFACGLISYFWLRHIARTDDIWTVATRVFGFIVALTGPICLTLLLTIYLLLSVDWDKEAKW